MGAYIKVNLPRTHEDFVRGNGEGIWVEVDYDTKRAHDNDHTGGLFVGVLANDSLYYPTLSCGTPLPFTMRGCNRPVADFNCFLSKLHAISDEEKDALIQHIMEAHPELSVESQDDNQIGGDTE